MEAWQKAGFNAKKELPLPAGLGSPKRLEMGFGAFACGGLDGLEGFGGFDGWQTAGFNAKKNLLGWALMHLPAGLRVPKRGLKRLRWALVPLPAGFGVPKRNLEGLRVLEGLTAGKRQASTPRKSYWDGP